MSATLRNPLYVRSFVLGLLVVMLIVGLSSVPWITPIGAILLPGMLLAALVFPTGIHSDQAVTYMVLAAACDVFLFSLPILVYLRRRQRLKSCNR